MPDFQGFYQLLKSVTINTHKATHRPKLSDKESMVAYQKATGNTGKALFLVG